MKRCLFTVAITLSVSTCGLGAPSEIRLPPFPHQARKGSYDVELKRTEVFNGKPFPSGEGNFHVDVTDTSIRVVSRRLTFSGPRSPKWQSEFIYSSKHNGSQLAINTETGIEPSKVVYMRHAADDESSFYSGFHGVNIINGRFLNLKGSLWDVIVKHADEIVSNKPVLPQGVEVRLLKCDGYWLLRRVSIHLDRSQKRLYSPKFYSIKQPSTDPLSFSAELDCEYGTNNGDQKYRYALSCQYEKKQYAEIRMDITVQNYRSEVAVPPLSDDGVYAPAIVAIPNGFRVGVVGEDIIEYMWQDGRIVRRIDRKALGAAKSVSFRRGSRSRLIWAVVSLVSLLLIVVVWLWLRRKAKGTP